MIALPAQGRDLVQRIGRTGRTLGVVDDLDAGNLVPGLVALLGVLESEADRADALAAQLRALHEWMIRNGIKSP